MVDRAVPRIRPKDQQLAQVQDNLCNAIQQLLDSANTPAAKQAITQAILAPVMQQLGGAGTAQSVKTPALQVKGRPDGAFVAGQPTIVIGEPAYSNAAGQPVAQKDSELNHYGQVNLLGSKVNADGFCIVPYVSGVAARISPNNSTNSLIAYTDGTLAISGPLNTPNVNSAAGVPSPLFMGTYCNSKFAATTPKQTVHTICDDNGGTIGVMNAFWRWPRSGSIVGWSYRQDRSGSGQNTMYVYKNGSNFYGAQTISNAGTAQGTITKGSYAFAAGDEMYVQVMGAASNSNFCASVTLLLEMAS